MSVLFATGRICSQALSEDGGNFSRPVSDLPSLLFCHSNSKSTFDRMADDTKKDLCAGPQLSAADHCSHHQSDCVALFRVSCTSLFSFFLSYPAPAHCPMRKIFSIEITKYLAQHSLVMHRLRIGFECEEPLAPSFQMLTSSLINTLRHPCTKICRRVCSLVEEHPPCMQKVPGSVLCIFR